MLKGSGRFFTRFGNSSNVRPSRVLPASFFLTPPHCLKKKGTFARLHCSHIDNTQSSFIGRAPGPLSPPTITHEIPSSETVPRSSSNGSTERNLTPAGLACKSAILGKPCFRFSTDTPHQICCSPATYESDPRSKSSILSDRFVSTWYVCHRATFIIPVTLLI